MGNVLAAQGDLAQALQSYREGKAIAERMTKLSPDNAEWKNDLAWFEGQITAREKSPFQEAKSAVEVAFGAREYAKAAAVQTKLAAAMEKAERKRAGKPGPDSALALLELSWYQLFAQDFEGALAASDRAFAIEPEEIINATNKAHALMFLGRRREARALYLRYKGQRLGKNERLWEETILDDFKEFEKRGLKHRQIAEIKVLLAQKELRRKRSGQL